MSEVPPELLALRGAIDNMDAALIHLLAERFRITQEVGELKAARGLPPADPAREAQQIARLRRLAVESNLDPEFAEKVITFIVAEVVRHHEAIAEDTVTGPDEGAGDEESEGAGRADEDDPGEAAPAQQ